MPINTYASHTAYKFHCISTVVDILTQNYCTYQSKKQKYTTLIYYAITIYVSATNMPQKCHIYAICANYSMCINVGSMPMYIPHMNSLTSIMWPGTLYADDDTQSAKDRDSTANGNRHDMQMKHIAKIKPQLAGYELHACLSNFNFQVLKPEKLIRIYMIGHINSCQIDNILYLDTNIK